MMVYSVYLPSKVAAIDTVSDRARFVRDGFRFSAFVFGPLWLCWHRLWLALAFYVLAVLAIEFAGQFFEFDGLTRLLFIGMIELFIGLEGVKMLDAKLQRKGYYLADIVDGAKRDEFESRFFYRWAQQQESRPPLNNLTSANQLAGG